jgi:hypothetical protein
MTSDGGLVPLRRTIQPYFGQTLILVLVTAFAVFESVTSSDWSFMWGPAVFLPLCGIYFLYFGLQYRVFWDKECVVMRASGGPERRIRFDEITTVKYEVSSAKEVVAQSRPFRRIVVCGREDDPTARVDISLRHFELKDIDQLLTTIHERRPDLDVPRIRASNAASNAKK